MELAREVQLRQSTVIGTNGAMRPNHRPSGDLPGIPGYVISIAQEALLPALRAGSQGGGSGAVAPSLRRRHGIAVPPGSHRLRAAPGWGGAQIFSLGHSTRPIEELIALLQGAGVATLADIRTIPRSRFNPQYEGPALACAVSGAGIRYAHLPRLGGLRRPRPDSPNGAWRNASFRGYADHLATPEFEEGLRELRGLAAAGPVAVLCAEAVPWRCHRLLLADALLARGVTVQHVTGPGRSRPHRLTRFARLEGRRVTYPPTGHLTAFPAPPRAARRSPPASRPQKQPCMAGARSWRRTQE